MAIGALLALPAAASADVLYDQTTGTHGLIVPSSHFVTGEPHDADAADDFVVPPGVLWNLTSVDVQGQAPSAQTGNVVLFADAAGLPGAELFRQGGIPFAVGSSQNLPLSGVPPLPPGHYWLSVYTTWTGSSWIWRLQSPTTGYPAVWENPPNGDGTGCVTFKALDQCNFTPSNGTDLVFRLTGTATPLATRRQLQQRRRCKRSRQHHHALSASKRHCKKRSRSR